MLSGDTFQANISKTLASSDVEPAQSVPYKWELDEARVYTTIGQILLVLFFSTSL